MKVFHRLVLVLMFLILAGCNKAELQKPDSDSKVARFVVTFPREVRCDPVSGRVLLFLSKNPNGEPRRHLNFMDPEPVFAIDVENIQPGQQIEFLDKNFEHPEALAFPGPLRRLEPAEYRAQVLIDIDNTRRSFNDGPGNLYSEPIEVTLGKAIGGRSQRKYRTSRKFTDTE